MLPSSIVVTTFISHEELSHELSELSESGDLGHDDLSDELNHASGDLGHA